MNKLALLSLFFTISVYSQEKIYFEEEITFKNGFFYSKDEGTLLSGTLYEEDSRAQNKCKCIKRRVFYKGKLHGKESRWFLNGNKSFEGNYKNARPVGNHTFFNENGTVHTRKNYSSLGDLLSTITYYPSGNQKSKHRYMLDGKFISESFYDTKPEKIRLYEERKDDKPIGIHYELSEEGDTLSFAHYGKENILFKRTYKEGKISSTTQWVEEVQLAHTKIIFPLNGNVTQEYFETSHGLKDSIHTWYLADGSRHQEMAYNQGILMYEGNYSDNKKNGKWLYYPSSTSIKLVDYSNGEETQSRLYNKNNNIKKILSEQNDSSLYRYTSETGNSQNVLIQILNSDIENARIRQIVSYFMVQLRKRMEHVRNPNKYDFLDKKILIDNIKFRLEEFEFEKKKIDLTQGLVFVPTTGYECYITMSIELHDNEGTKLYAKKHEFNRSNNVLSILGNAVASSYATSPQKAFERVLKDIKLDKIFVDHFPVASDKKRKKRKNN